MSNAIGSFMGGLGRIGGDVMHGNFGGALGEVGKDIMGAPGWLGSVFSGSTGKTGQPMGGMPGAGDAIKSQSATALPNVGGGVSPNTASAIGKDMNFNSSGGGLTDDFIRSITGGASGPTPAPDALAAGAAGSNLTDDAIQRILGPYGSGANANGATLSPEDMTKAMAGGEGKGPAPGGGFDLGHFLTRTALPGAMLGYQIMQANNGFPGQGRLESMARDRLQQSRAMEQGAIEAMNGHLPSSAEAGVQQGLRAAQATIRSRYANMGLSGSTMEADDLANAELQAESMRFQIGQQMAQTGLTAAGNANSTASALYELIMNGMIQQGTQLGNALAAFAGATAQ